MATKNQPESLNQINETGTRSLQDRRESNETPNNENRKSQRRRLIDPTTCERDYSDHEIEFMQAMDEYKRRSGRMFPTCSEILEVIEGIGYRKVELDPTDSPAVEEEVSEKLDNAIEQFDLEMDDDFDM